MSITQRSCRGTSAATLPDTAEIAFAVAASAMRRAVAPPILPQGELIVMCGCPTLGEDGPIDGAWRVVSYHEDPYEGDGAYCLTCRPDFPCLVSGRARQDCAPLPFPERCANCRVITEAWVRESDLFAYEAEVLAEVAA